MIRYRLKKDLPYVKEGAVYSLSDDAYWCHEGEFVSRIDNDRLNKAAVENNPSWFELIKEEPKEWEIISYNHWKTGGVSLIPSMHKDDPTIIHSVKRIRDGEVFTVGDEIVNEFCELIKIDRFEYANGMTFPAACSGINGYTIDKIKKHTPKTKEVFTWDDALVNEYYNFVKNNEHVFGKLTAMEKFKQSKASSTNYEGWKISDVDPKPDTSKERIEVKNLQYYGRFTADYRYIFQFTLNTDNIPSDKYDSIKQAIESVLNNDVNFNIDLSAIENISIGSRSLTPKELIALMFKEGAIELVRKYTQSDMDKAIEDTWKACRETTDQPIGRGEYNDGDCGDLYRNKYPTLESYLQTIKK